MLSFQPTPLFKRLLYTFAVGGLGGLVFIFVFSRLTFIPGIGNILFSQIKAEKIVEREVKIVSQDEGITEQINKISQSIVLIQSFQGGKVLRFGSGLVLTGDGLILTANNVIPIGADVLQVSISDKIFRAKIAKRNWKDNLVLLKIPETNLSAVTLSSGSSMVGDIGYISGKYIDINKILPFAQQAIVSRVAKNFIVLDSRYSNDLSGAAFLNRNGEVKGIIFVDGSRVLAIESGVIKNFFEASLKDL